MKRIDNSFEMPMVEVPVITTVRYADSLYVQMNVQSWVIVSDKKTEKYRGFIFEIQNIKKVIPSLPEEVFNDFQILLDTNLQETPMLQLASKFPILYHPHFTNAQYSKWVEPDVEYNYTTIGSYLLRIANSLQYKSGYIFNEGKLANKYALKAYLKDLDTQDCFPSDDLHIPSPRSFKVNSPVQKTPLHKKFDISTKLFGNSFDTKPKKKFEIKEEQPGYVPTEKVKPNFYVMQKLSSDFRGNKYYSRQENTTSYEDFSHAFFMMKSAFDSISQHISWGKDTRTNRVEQGGILLGHSYIDPKTKQTYCIAEQSVAGKSAKGSGAYLEMTHDTWKEMLDIVDDLHSELQIIGWYHTHPDSLDVFMSGTDIATQSRVFGQDWQFAIVLNPHKKIWRAFYGKSSKECEGCVIDFSEISKKETIISEPAVDDTQPEIFSDNLDTAPKSPDACNETYNKPTHVNNDSTRD